MKKVWQTGGCLQRIWSQLRWSKLHHIHASLLSSSYWVIYGGILLIYQNTTMRVYGAWRYCVLCLKTYNTSRSPVITSHCFTTGCYGQLHPWNESIRKVQNSFLDCWSLFLCKVPVKSWAQFGSDSAMFLQTFLQWWLETTDGLVFPWPDGRTEPFIELLGHS